MPEISSVLQYLTTFSCVHMLTVYVFSIVTIGPLVLLCLLTVTFYLGSRTRISDVPRRKMRLSRTESVASTSSGGPMIPGNLETAERGNVAAPDALPKFDREEDDKNEDLRPMSPSPKTRGILKSHRSVRSVWKAGPGDDPRSDQVTS